ncbi:MAG: YaiI/YqxD family protein [Gemmataceae bacterium]
MPTLYLDADACPVKDESYRVAGRYSVPTVVVANAYMRVPVGPLVELVVRAGFGAADDHIAEVCGPGDVVVTADIPLAGRALLKGARVLDPRGREITDNEIGAALGMRELMEELRARGEASGGPPPMTAKDRSRFLGKLDEVLVAVRRGR